MIQKKNLSNFLKIIFSLILLSSCGAVTSSSSTSNSGFPSASVKCGDQACVK